MKNFITTRRGEGVRLEPFVPARAVFVVALTVLCLAGMRSVSRAQPTATTMQTGAVTVQTSSADDAVRQLTSRDALVRKRAAEELARMADTERRRIVEGYRLQEKDGRVRVALDWALYRMGKNEALYNVVRALESSRSDQASVYLSELESPAPLYVFLERANGHTQIKLLEVLAYSGDAETLERIKPLAASLDPLIVEAAKKAADEISRRLAEAPSPAPAPARQRRSDDDNDNDTPEETSP